ncbi:hypothetical protein SS05631_c22250 [Sinorhizobium sp. CCBAU 05631]|nr:hypothetical protein SS05631_c22250 [Sinorhizobium sp. CCBAU 05631]
MLTLLTGAFALVCLFAFQGWLAHSADIFLAFAETGVSWCF